MAPLFWQNSASKDSTSDSRGNATSQKHPVQERGTRHSATSETTHIFSSTTEGRGVRHAATTESVHSGGPVTRSVAQSLSTASSRHAFTPAERADLSSHVFRQNGYSASTTSLLSSSQLARCPVPAIPDAAAVMSGAVAGDKPSPSNSKSDTGEKSENGGVSDCAQEKRVQKENEQEKSKPAATEPEEKSSKENSNTTGGGGVNISFVVCNDASTSTSNSSNNTQESRSHTVSIFRNQTITNRAFPYGARVTDCQLSNCSGSGLRVTDCSFSNCNFTDSRITDCRFSGSTLSGCRIRDCVFSGSRVVDSRVDGCRHSGSTLIEIRENGGTRIGGGGGAGGGVTITFDGNDLSPEAQTAIVAAGVGIALASLVLAGLCMMYGEYDPVRGAYTL